MLVPASWETMDATLRLNIPQQGHSWQSGNAKQWQADIPPKAAIWKHEHISSRDPPSWVSPYLWIEIIYSSIFCWETRRNDFILRHCSQLWLCFQCFNYKKSWPTLTKLGRLQRWNDVFNRPRCPPKSTNVGNRDSDLIRRKVRMDLSIVLSNPQILSFWRLIHFYFVFSYCN